MHERKPTSSEGLRPNLRPSGKFPFDPAAGEVSPVADLSDVQIKNIFDKPVYQDIIQSDAFQRLRQIRFLGAIDYVLSVSRWGGQRTRFQHSLRVAELAMRFAEYCGIDEPDKTLLVISGLLHDIGHAPLSHSLESTFRARFGITHHEATRMIVSGAVPLGKTLNVILKRHGVPPDKVLAIIDCTSPAPYVEAFRCPINVDTIEAITRSYFYLRPKGPTTAPERIVQAAVRQHERDIPVLDEFWQLKDRVYNLLITSDLGLTADRICQQYMEEHFNLWKGVYFHTEVELRKRHRELFDRLRAAKAVSSREAPLHRLKVQYSVRRFTIDVTTKIRGFADMYKRYQQTRTLREKEISY